MGAGEEFACFGVVAASAVQGGEVVEQVSQLRVVRPDLSLLCQRV